MMMMMMMMMVVIGVLKYIVRPIFNGSFITERGGHPLNGGISNCSTYCYETKPADNCCDLLISLFACCLIGCKI